MELTHFKSDFFLFLFFSFFVGILKYFPSPLSLCFFNSFESQFWDIYVFLLMLSPPQHPTLCSLQHR